jgi:hypothetical protein
MFRILTDEERHEARCRRCGMSCHTPILLSTQSVIIPELHCRYLNRNEENGEYFCTVYERRHEVAPWCKTVAESIRPARWPGTVPTWPVCRTIAENVTKSWERGKILKAVRSSLLLTVADNPDAAVPIPAPYFGRFSRNRQSALPANHRKSSSP